MIRPLTLLLTVPLLVAPRAHAAPGAPPTLAVGQEAGARSAIDGEDEPTAPSAQRTPMSTKAARRILRAPRGSTSIGGTSSGSLIGASALPERGRGWAILPHMRGRATRYGTKELVRAIERSARAVAKAFPGSTLGIGNLGFAKGGKIPWSVSHRAGRDADLGMYARDARGHRIELKRFIHFDADGEAASGRYRFDTERNLALVRALVEDTDTAAVQYIFVAEWLKRRLLAEAQRQSLPAETIARLAEVLHQPSDSNPHSDHFHIRLFCTPQDRLHGCLDRGPRRAWVDLGDDLYDAHIDKLVRIVTELPEAPKLRRRAIAKLGKLRARRALPTLVTCLEDASAKTRRAALLSIRALATPEAEAPLLGVISRTPDGAWAAKLFDAIRRLNTARSVPTALRAVSEPETLLNPSAVKVAAPRLRIAGARILGRFGRKEAAPPLIELLGDDDVEVRRAAHAALSRVTNQRISDRGLRSRSARRRARVVKRWRAFYKKERDASWLQWMRLGFEARGVRFRGKMASRRGVERLIRLVTSRDRVAGDNAVKALSELTGHYVDPAWRNPRNNQRHWRSWWKANAQDVRLP